MKRALAVSSAALVLASTLSACGGNAFCDTADETLGEVDTRDTAAALAAFEELRPEAPEEIQGDLDTAIEQLRLIEDGDVAQADAVAIVEAGENLTAWQDENC